jgi:hypothetical protein
MSADFRDYFRLVVYIDWVRKSLQTERGRQIGFALGGVVGAALICVAGYWVYGRVMGVPTPDAKNAPAEQIAHFLGHSEGFARLPAKKRMSYLNEVMVTHSDAEPARKEELASALQKMTTEEKVTLREAVWDVGYKNFVDEVDVYYRTPPEEKADFVDKKIHEYYRLRCYLTGDSGHGGGGGGGRGAIVDQSWAAGLPTDSDGLVKSIVARTRPEDRAEMKPYVDALRTRLLELKKDPRERERLLARYSDSDPTLGGLLGSGSTPR